ncbi:molybdenum cofactor biosynthesis protein MoaE [Herbiconiux sp. P17]|uniref:molybdenum cofactor biosynthesis protein MoaE n=1 Tax=Herbiconiux wuyangfengii TaxID=3342794 RepID=UPI0035B7B267
MPDTTDIGGVPRNPGSASERVRFALVAESAISVEECITAVEGPGSGAVVSFAGVVRDHDEGRGVVALSYSAHPSATEVIRTVALEVARAYPAVVVAVAHRVGDLGVGDVALACAVASAHRGDAFAACAALVDEVKAKVPIWKEQSFDDGTSEWVASIG